MSGQVLELIIFAFLAFFIINKLISILGKVSTDEEIRFGEVSLKDVTHSVNSSMLTPKLLEQFVVKENKEIVEKGLQELLQRIPFNIEQFMKHARLAFAVIIDSVSKNDNKQLEELVDKRYIESFKKLALSGSYSCFLYGIPEPIAKLAEVCFFGNDIFIKVLFSVSDSVVHKETPYLFHEEWTFSKSTLTTNPTWYLTDVGRHQ